MATIRDLLNAARAAQSPQWEIGRVRTRADDPTQYLVQVPGRGHNMVARANELHVAGDEVMVTLRPNASIPGVVGVSPWRTASTEVASLSPVGPDGAVTVTTGGVVAETHDDGSDYVIADFDSVAARVRTFFIDCTYVLDGGTY